MKFESDDPSYPWCATSSLQQVKLVPGVSWQSDRLRGTFDLVHQLCRCSMLIS